MLLAAIGGGDSGSTHAASLRTPRSNNPNFSGVVLPSLVPSARDRFASPRQPLAPPPHSPRVPDGGWSLPKPEAHERVQHFERRLQEQTGRPLAAMRLLDIQKNSDLRTELATLRLNEFFDDRGAPRFRRLSLSFAAKQHPQVKAAFGSRIGREATTEKADEPKVLSAKAYFLATEAKEKDLEYGKERSEQLLSSIDNAQRHRVEEVRQRQLEVVFSEVPDFMSYIPAGALRSDILPRDYDREEELRERRVADRAGLHLDDSKWTKGRTMNWHLTHGEALVLSQVAALWTRTSRGTNCPMGMDRATFCRFILDTGLVDQVKVPFYWAVSVFDDAACQMRCCPQDIPVQHAPLVPVVNRWLLVHILDLILRVRFDSTTRTLFLARLFTIARYRLPAFVIEESGLREESIAATLESGKAPSPSPEGGPRTREEASNPVDNNLGRLASDVGADETGESAQLKKVKQSVVDKHKEALMRNQLMRSMLVEPEVLHIIAQHHSLFSHLHQCYCDQNGRMSFAQLLQLCTDFAVMPRLASSHFLAATYAAAVCVEVVQHRVGSATSRRSKWVSQARRQSAPTGKMSAPLKRKTCRVLRNGLRSGDLKRVVDEFDPTGRTNTATAGAGAAALTNASPPATSSPCRPLHIPSEHSGQALVETLLDVGAAAVKALGGHDIVGGHVGETLPSAHSLRFRTTTVFGVGAMVETLCMVAFTHLGSYGNNLQQCTNGHTRVIWLIAYLRCVFVHLTQSLDKRPPAEGGHQVVGPALLQVLRTTPLSMWTAPPWPAVPILPPTVVRSRCPDEGQKHANMVVKRKKLSARRRSSFDKIKSVSLASAFATRVARSAAKSKEGPTEASQSSSNAPLTAPGVSEKLQKASGERVPSIESARGSQRAGERMASAESGRLLNLLERHTTDRLTPPRSPQSFSQGTERRRTRKRPSCLPADMAENAAIMERRSSQSWRREAERRFSECSLQSASEQDLIGMPCIQNGVCMICQHCLDENPFGNVMCWACSVVDVLGFQHHLFRPLLIDWPEDCRPEGLAAKHPSSVDRHSLTPPPMGGAQTFRRDRTPTPPMSARNSTAVASPTTACNINISLAA